MPDATFFPGGRGLALFLNAGDPPLERLHDVVQMLDEARVDCLELAIPFPDSFTDGPVIRRSAQLALDTGVTAGKVLKFIDYVQSGLRHTRIALLADWSHTVRPTGLPDFLRKVRDSGAHGLLVHGLPPTQQASYHDTAAELGVPVVTTCYPTSPPDVIARAARNATAYVYLVSRFGRTGAGSAPIPYDRVAGTCESLRHHGLAPIAVGFGVQTAQDVAALHGAGADAAVIGSAVVARVAHCLATDGDVVANLHEFVQQLRSTQ